MTLGIVSLVFLVAFEAMAVATAMPVAVADLHGLAYYAWGFSGFMTASMLGTVVAGQVADRHGPVRPFVGGAVLFAFGLLVTGSAPSMLVFVAGRVVQGLGGGAAVVPLYLIIARMYPGSLRPRVFSAMSSAWVLPAIVGPIVAGALAEHVSWRLAFLGLFPLVALPLCLVLPLLRRPSGPEGIGPAPETAGPKPTGRTVSKRWLALAAALGLGLIQFAGQQLRWSSLLVLAAGLVLLVPSLPRLLPPGTVRLVAGLPSVIGVRGILAGAFAGTEAFVPLMLVQHRHLSTTLAGLVLTAGAIGWSAGAWWQGRPRQRAPRWRLIQCGAGFLALGVGLVLLTVVPAVPPPVAALAWVSSGLGMGLATASQSVLMLEMSARSEQGFNSAALQMSDAMGSVIFIGFGGVLFASLHGRLDGPLVFAAIYVSMIVVASCGVLVARRCVRAETG